MYNGTTRNAIYYNNDPTNRASLWNTATVLTMPYQVNPTIQKTTLDHVINTYVFVSDPSGNASWRLFR